ncbi:MAG TPA: MBL fold metallo-hydrolase [Chloroflexota bacterium]|nr:MBL fold metallo-hydrolase [Chloroflexota bacterium]
MQVTIIGAHQAETAQFRFPTILVDGGLAIDAGSLASGLSVDQQLNVTDVLITHQHWDHVKDLNGFGFNLYTKFSSGGGPTATVVFCTDEVKQSLEKTTLSPGVWMDFFNIPDAVHPTFIHRSVQPNGEYFVGQFTVRAIPVNHSVPTLGYQLTEGHDRRLFYTGDNGPGAAAYWVNADPTVLITECTFSNALAGVDDGKMFGHLCPSQLQTELETFRARKGYLPRVYLIHVNPFYEAQIRQEVAEVAKHLGSPVEVASEGTSFTV